MDTVSYKKYESILYMLMRPNISIFFILSILDHTVHFRSDESENRAVIQTFVRIH